MTSLSADRYAVVDGVPLSAADRAMMVASGFAFVAEDGILTITEKGSEWLREWCRSRLEKLPQAGESWQSKDKRDNGLTVHVEKVEGGFVTYKRLKRRRIRIEGFLKLYRPFATEQA